MMDGVQLLITGYPGFDRILRVSRPPAIGETGIILDPPGIPEPTPGGCANNIAVAASRLGVGAAPLIVLGDDGDGSLLRDKLEAEGVDTRLVHHVAGGKTAGTFLFIDPTGGHQTFYFPGSASENIDLSIPDELLTSLRYAVVTVGNPFHNRMFIERMVAAKVPLVWSLRNDVQAFPPDLVEQLARVCRILFMNEYEASQLVKTLGLPDLPALFDWGVEMIAMTLGSHGSCIYSPKETVEIPIVKPIAFVDPTGAGDAYIGGFLAGLCRGTDLPTAGRIAATTSSFVLERWGCQTGLPTWEQMESRYLATFGGKPVIGGAS